MPALILNPLLSVSMISLGISFWACYFVGEGSISLCCKMAQLMTGQSYRYTFPDLAELQGSGHPIKCG